VTLPEGAHWSGNEKKKGTHEKRKRNRTGLKAPLLLQNESDSRNSGEEPAMGASGPRKE